MPGAGRLAFEDPYRILQVTVGLSRKVTVGLAVCSPQNDRDLAAKMTVDNSR
jgi:hypothetical protein